MLKIDQTSLIEFFEAPPIKQNEEEQEFFGSTIFEVTEEEIKLSIAFFEHHNEVSIDLYNLKSNQKLVDMCFKNIVKVDIVKDNQLSTPFLSILKNQDIEIAKITLKPLKIIVNKF